MALNAPPEGYKVVNVRKGFKKYTYLGCPLTNNRTPWCFRICTPNANGTGFCGRVAPHGFKSRIQQGIEDFKKKQAKPSNLPPCLEQNSGKDS